MEGRGYCWAADSLHPAIRRWAECPWAPAAGQEGSGASQPMPLAAGMSTCQPLGKSNGSPYATLPHEVPR